MKVEVNIPYSRLKLARSIGHSLLTIGEIKNNTDKDILEWLLEHAIPNVEGRRQINTAAARVMTRGTGSKSDEISIIRDGKKSYRTTAPETVKDSSGFIPPIRGVKGRDHVKPKS